MNIVRNMKLLGATLGVLALFAKASAAQTAAPAPLAPVPVTILKSSPATAPGLIFITPNGGGPTGSHGAQIIDDRGRPVWFKPLPAGDSAFDLRVQRYHGEPVVTWIESLGGFSTGPTKSLIVDRHYRVLATVQAGNGLTQDIHELFLTREGTALITIYNTVPRDLSALGGPVNGQVTEGVVQEIDIANGRVLFEWHSLDHVGLDESEARVPTTAAAGAWDYFHLNAVTTDQDGQLLIGARNTWTAYRLDRRTGKVLWRLGGKKSDFALGAGVAFAWQHNPTAVDDHGLVRIFDNEAAPPVLPYSRVIWVRHDDRRKTATLERWFKHPDGLLAGSQGNAQGLDNGDTFVDWGALPRFSEFDRHDDLIFDAALPATYNSYRAYRHEWHAEPDARPVATASLTADGNTQVHAIWNGATDVARWDVVAVSSDGDRDDRDGSWNSDDRRRVASADWNGLDTAIDVSEPLGRVAVVARSRDGRVIGRSAPVEVTP